MEIFWDISRELKEQIRHLPPVLKHQVWDAIDGIQKNPKAGKPLSEELAGYRSYRIGRYRLIYRVGEERLVLEAFGSRKDIYERMVLEIGRYKIRERAIQSAQGRKKIRVSSKPKLSRRNVSKMIPGAA